MIEKVLAADWKLDTSGLNTPAYNSASGWGDLIDRIVTFALGVMAFMAFMGIVYSGYMIITAGGDASKAGAGRKNLIMSIIGVVVLSLSYVIVRLIISMFSSSEATP